MSKSHTAIAGQDRQASRVERIARSLATFFGLGDEPGTHSPRPANRKRIDRGDAAPAGPILTIVETEAKSPVSSSFRWRRHPQLLSQPAPDLAPDEREARHEAVRGLFAARAGALACAEKHFTEAARCEAIDLTAIPGFWSLERRAMMAAVNAYEASDRIRDASALNARIRSMYRPRAISPLPENVTHIPQAPEKASRTI